MTFEFVPVTGENISEAIALHIAESQKGSVESVEECWEEALEFPLWRPVMIRADDEEIGFAMYGLWIYEGERGRVWLDRFFIDRRFQGRGLGKACLPELLAHIRKAYGREEIFLSVYEDNRPAIALYEKFGFFFNGELDINGEKVMVLP